MFNSIIFFKFQETNSSFFTEGGKTYYGTNGDLFGDFTLKIVGEMNQRKTRVAGEYVLTCGTVKHERNMGR